MNKTETNNLISKFNDYPESERKKQLAKNQKALKLLEKMIQEENNMSDEEAKERGKYLKEFKELVDSFRPIGQKLYSES